MLHAGLMFCLWALAAPGAPQSGSIAGTVVDDATRAPIGRAVVKLRTKGAEPLEAVAWTDDSGSFSFSWVPPGQYFLSAERQGYETAHYGATRSGQPPEILAMTAGADRRVVLLMRLVGSISGTVSDSEGDGVPNVNVRVLVPGFNRRKPRYNTVRAAITDSRGRYHITQLPAGKYVLMATAFGMPGAPRAEVVRGQPADDTRYAPQFYPNADAVGAASPVVLAPGKDLEGIDFHLNSQAVTSVEGKILLPADAGTNAQIALWVQAEDVTGEGTFHGYSVKPSDGTFQVRDVFPGRYVLIASVIVQGHAYRGVEHIDAGQNPLHVTLRLDAGVDLSGTVRLEGNPGGDLPRFRVWLSAGDGLPAVSGTPEAEVKPDGSFRLTGVQAGVWDIGVEPVPKGGFIKSMRLGGQDVLTEEMVIGPETREPLNIVVSARGAVVEGSVTDAAGEKVRRAYVLLAPAGARENVWSFYRTVPVDENGHFEMDGITPGAYKLYALARMDTDPSEDPAFLSSLAGHGDPIELKEGERVTRDLHLIPEPAQEPEAK